MNCLGARRALSVDPRRLSAQVQSHIARCQECQLYQTTVLRMDEQVMNVLRAPKRAGLQKHLLLAHSSRSRRWRASMGVAALVLIGVIAFASRLDLTREAAAADWPLLMTERLLKDPMHELVPDPEAAIRFQRALADIGVVERESLPGLHRASICVLNGELAVHIHFEVEGEPVVAFVLARNATVGQIYEAGWTGEVHNVNGGSFGVFTRSGGTTLAAARRQLEKGLSWRSARAAPLSPKATDSHSPSSRSPITRKSHGTSHQRSTLSTRLSRLSRR